MPAPAIRFSKVLDPPDCYHLSPSPTGVFGPFSLYPQVCARKRSPCRHPLSDLPRYRPVLIPRSCCAPSPTSGFPRKVPALTRSRLSEGVRPQTLTMPAPCFRFAKVPTSFTPSLVLRPQAQHPDSLEKYRLLTLETAITYPHRRRANAHHAVTLYQICSRYRPVLVPRSFRAPSPTSGFPRKLPVLDPPDCYHLSPSPTGVSGPVSAYSLLRARKRSPCRHPRSGFPRCRPALIPRSFRAPSPTSGFPRKLPVLDPRDCYHLSPPASGVSGPVPAYSLLRARKRSPYRHPL